MHMDMNIRNRSIKLYEMDNCNKILTLLLGTLVLNYFFTKEVSNSAQFFPVVKRPRREPEPSTPSNVKANVMSSRSASKFHK